MLTLVSRLRLADYILDPSTVVTHVVAIGLLCALRLQGVGRRLIVLVSVAEGIFAYVLWRTFPSGLGTVIVLWVFLNLYEYILGPRLTIRSNAVLQSGDSYVEVVLKQEAAIQYDIKKDECGVTYVESNLGFAVFASSLWHKQVDIGKHVCLDDVAIVKEGCIFEILKRFRAFGIQRDRLISLIMDVENLIIVFVAETRTERDHWMVIFQRILGTQVVDIRAAWLSKITLTRCKGSVEADQSTNFEDALDILMRAGRPYDRGYANELFKKMTKTNGIKWKLTGTSTLNKDQLYSFFSYAVHRPEIAEIYSRLLEQKNGKSTLHRTRFHEFVRTEQKQDIPQDTIRTWIQKNEPIFRCLSLSQIGFCNYLLSDEHSIFRSDHRQVYQDMNRPLSHYYIATSHNTYLTKDQLTSKSSVDAYVSALKRGCKCVELDIWDGTNNEPVVYHGYTLTSKILVKDVLQAIKDYAFYKSRYPVILSFENHCSTEQQKIVARYLREILGDMLYTRAIPDGESELPSPSQLKGYIIVKGKKLKLGLEEVEEELDDEVFFDDDIPEDFELLHLATDQKLNSDGGAGGGKPDDVLSLRSENDEDEFTSSESIAERRKKVQSTLNEIKENLAKMKKNSPKTKDLEKKLAKEFSDLVSYCQATGFKGFDYAKENNKHYEMVSIAEKRAFKLAREESVAMIQFSRRQLCRIYPSGARIDSSNYDPVAMWNVGCQMVALNYQTPSLGMQLNQALFQDNGCSGYVLKPRILTEDELGASDPRKTTDNFQTLKLRVISGFQIPYKNEKILKSDRNLSVQVKICGFESDVQCCRTKIVKNNGLNPVWNEDLVFRIHVPDLALIIFTVLTKDAYSGHFALPVRCMQQGYRRVPLLNKFSEPEPSSHIFVHISLTS